MRGRIAVLLLLGLNAWAQAPKITAVVTTGLHDASFAPGSQVYIYGAFAAQSAVADYSITVGGQTGAINVAYNTTLISATIPINAPTGSQTLSVTYQGQASNALPITLVPLAPQFSGGGVETFAPTTPAQFTPYYPFLHGANNSPVTPMSPASPGEVLETTVYGIAQQLPPATVPTIGVAGQNCTIQLGTASNGRVSFGFTVPFATTPGMQPVMANVAGVNTNSVLLPVGQAPAIASIVNSASFSTGAAVAPGSIVSVFGANFGNKDNLSAFPATASNDISVLFNGAAVPMFALSATGGQINVLVPTELAPSGTVNVTVQGANATSAVTALRLATAAPGIFFYGDPLVPTRRNAVAVTANTAWIAMPLSMAASLQLPTNCSALGAAAVCAQPAHAGDYLVVYTTGLGKATQDGDPNGAVLPTGTVTPVPVNGKPVYATVAAPTVSIAGQTAAVLFSGLVPGNAGLYQINVQIPAGVAPGDDVALQVSMAGTTDTATIAIAAK